MTFHIITIFPESIKGYLDSSILGRAQKSGAIKINFINLRDFSEDRHKKVDDKQFGGGPGMVMQIEPILKAIESILNSKLEARNSKQIQNSKNGKIKIIIFSPIGKQFTQKMAVDFSKKYDDIILICGHYEGIDARLKKVISSQYPVVSIKELSVGPYVLTGGELPAAVVIDAISRHIPGVLGKQESLEDERGIGIPVYTRPEIFELAPLGGGKSKAYKVPKVLLSGHHEKIKEWREKQVK